MKPETTPYIIPSYLEQKPRTKNNENVICAVLSLLNDLDEMELELIKRDIEKWQQYKKFT